MPPLKPGHISPTPEEERAINRGIALDPDTDELTEEDFKWMRPAREALPELVAEYLTNGGHIPIAPHLLGPKHRIKEDPDVSPEPGKDLLGILDSYNRKERFFLLAQALNATRDSGGFSLGHEFFNKLLDVVFDENDPEPFYDYYAAMDYHLDSLVAALYEFREGRAVAVPSTDAKLIKGNQEDVDLLVALRGGKAYYLLFIEAKGASPWDNKQAKSKAKRLQAIFGPEGNRIPGVTPRFCLLSPKKPQRLDFSGWPCWMAPDGEPPWLELKMRDGRRRVKRPSEGKAEIVPA